MALSLDLSLRQKQRLAMTPQLYQAIKILQLSTLDLVDLVEQERLENPVLEVRTDGDEGTADEAPEDVPEEAPETAEASGEGAAEEAPEEAVPNPPAGEVAVREPVPEAVPEEDETREKDPFDIDWADYFDDASDPIVSRREAVSDDDEERGRFIEGALTRMPTLSEHLLWQLRLSTLTPKQFEIGEMLVTSVDGNGYLSPEAFADTAKRAGVSEEEAERVLAVIQTFDPAGVGARNLRECLLVQLRQEERHDPFAEAIVENYLDLLERKKYKEIARRLGIPLSAVRDSATFIASLEPRPGRRFTSEPTRYVVPDLTVEKVSGEFLIIMNDEWVPRLRISRYYRELYRKGPSREVKEYLESKFNAASCLIKSIEQRRGTLYRTMASILEVQRDFFEFGVKYLKPLTRKEIAAKIEMHESTVSRVTTDKYVQTPWGIFPMKFFFSSGIEGQDGTRSSSRSVKEMIRDIVQSEEQGHTLSDQKIVELLSKRGIRIARRTVSKYRKTLKILPSTRRGPT